MLMGTQKIWTRPYHPQTSGQCERFNSTLIGMLGTLPPEKKLEWKNHIRMLVHAYNCTRNSATGFSPYYFMYRRQVHLPVDVTLGFSTSHNNGTKHIQICAKDAGTCEMGSEKGRIIPSQGSTMPQMELQQKKQSSSLEGWGHSPSPCNCLQGPSMGEQGICSGKAAPSWCTSLCGMPQGWGRAQPEPAQELFSAHQFQHRAGWERCTCGRGWKHQHFSSSATYG